jgi:hypothetical protein
MKMLILRGNSGVYGGKNWPRGALDEPPALEYARRRGYAGQVLDVEGNNSGPHSAQTRMALEAWRKDEDAAALYGFSGGGYNARWVIQAMSDAEKQRLKLVVVLGAPYSELPAVYRPERPWEVVFRLDPPGGHMDGPRALLASLPPDP